MCRGTPVAEQCSGQISPLRNFFGVKLCACDVTFSASEWNAKIKDADVVALANGENVPILSAGEKPEPSFFEKIIRYVVLRILGLIQLLQASKKAYFWTRKIPFFNSRNFIVGRTARVFNTVLGMEKVDRYHLNPLKLPEQKGLFANTCRDSGCFQISVK